MIGSGVRELLAELKARGITATLEDGDVRLRPEAALSTELVRRARALKPELVLQLGALSDPITADVIRVFGGEAVADDDESTVMEAEDSFCLPWRDES